MTTTAYLETAMVASGRSISQKYALAKAKRWPLLYVGDDFTHTDIRAA